MHLFVTVIGGHGRNRPLGGEGQAASLFEGVFHAVPGHVCGQSAPGRSAGNQGASSVITSEARSNVR